MNAPERPRKDETRSAGQPEQQATPERTSGGQHTRRHAVALRYRSGSDAAPRVIAKGAGALAERILQTAREHGVHVHEDADLVALLAKLEVSTEIPEPLYQAVAEILAFIYRMNQELE